MSAPRDARRFLRAHVAGALATLSARRPGYPFGSLVPFALDHDCRPVLLISALAEHTRNLAAHPYASLMVHDAAEDVQAAARLTLIGDVAPLPSEHPARGRYLRRFPDAERLLTLGDFSFHAIAVREILFVRGFGRIDRIRAEEFVPPPSALADAEQSILAHMNAEHAETLRLYCRGLARVEAGDARMIGVDCDGCDVRADARLVRFDFDAPALDAQAVRAALVALAERARSM